VNTRPGYPSGKKLFNPERRNTMKAQRSEKVSLSKKLSLHKETLRELTETEFALVKGGTGPKGPTGFHAQTRTTIPTDSAVAYDPDDPKYTSKLSGCCKTVTR
jgi:hypothetical protein